MSITEDIKIQYLPLSQGFEVKGGSAIITSTLELPPADLSLTPTPVSSPVSMSFAETMVQPVVVKETPSTRQVLDSLAQLKNIFANEGLCKALLHLEAAGGTPNHTSKEDSFVHPDLPMSGASKLKRMLENTDDLIVCPGVYDGLSARAAMEVGFDALYMVLICPSSSLNDSTDAPRRPVPELQLPD